MNEYWVVEYLVPFASRWQPIHRSDDLTEKEADTLIEKYRRAMPGKEYRKRPVRYGDERGELDDDIPF